MSDIYLRTMANTNLFQLLKFEDLLVWDRTAIIWNELSGTRDGVSFFDPLNLEINSALRPLA